MYLQPKPKKPLGHPNPNGLIYLIHNETFIEKILKFTLATLGVLALVESPLGKPFRSVPLTANLHQRFCLPVKH
ncbi:hypothetical protein EJK49_1799 [Moraxella catarrhalis]|nr:hypothetical protein EJK49_1799 [Moraxella catarrhalis]